MRNPFHPFNLLGITIGVRIFGPVFGFLLGSICTSVYVDFPFGKIAYIIINNYRMKQHVRTRETCAGSSGSRCRGIGVAMKRVPGDFG